MSQKEGNALDSSGHAEEDGSNIDYGTTLQEQLEYLPFDANFEIDPSNLKLLKILEGGYFGDVHLGLLTSNGQQLPVAVKTPKSLFNERMCRMNEVELDQELSRQRESLRDELKIMSFLPANSNVIKLLGAITTGKDDFCVVTEYCEYGAMDSFLRRIQENDKFINELAQIADNEGYLVYRKITTDEEICNWMAEFIGKRESGYITTSDLLWFSLQIARAMSFLAENMVLHRDVALRNVLLKSDFTVRVADFGLSRRAGDNGSYVQHRNVAIPFRCIAPESLRSGRFSPRSESWSFGVVLWELFTFAKQLPYSGIDHCDGNTIDGILNYLDSGKRLQIPNCTPKKVATLISMLWYEDPLQRPTFKSCQDMLYYELLQSNPLLVKLDEVHSYTRLQRNIAQEIKATSKKEQEEFSKSRKIQRRLQWTFSLLNILGLLCIALLVAVYLILRPSAGLSQALSNESDSSAPNRSRTLIPLRWTWTFNSSSFKSITGVSKMFAIAIELAAFLYSMPPNDTPPKFVSDSTNVDQIAIGPEGILDVGCTSLIWFSFGIQKNLTISEDYFNRIPSKSSSSTDETKPYELEYSYVFSVLYKFGVSSVRAWTTQRLMSERGEEIMNHNDAYKDGFLYYLSSNNSYDVKDYRRRATLNSRTYYTLFVEMFVDATTIECKPVMYGSFPPVNIKKQCNEKTLQTERYLYYDGGCYVGSNSEMIYNNAKFSCNHLPGASTSRLAWVDNATLLEKLQTALVTKFYPPQKDEVAFVLGAFQLTDGLIPPLPAKAKYWWWMNSNGTTGKKIPDDWNLWNAGAFQPNDGGNLNERVIALYSNTKRFGLYDYFELDEKRYLCEYR